MTPRQIQLVRSTFGLVEPIADQAAQLFYGRLFALDPYLADLFAATDMKKQRRVLMGTLAVVVKGLDRLDTLTPAVEALGRRHVSYRVVRDDYGKVGAALLWTLEQGLGDAFTPEVHEAWATAYGLLASVMIAAADTTTAAETAA
jgi:hemoglobin-like flavoprotein